MDFGSQLILTELIILSFVALFGLWMPLSKLMQEFIKGVVFGLLVVFGITALLVIWGFVI